MPRTHIYDAGTFGHFLQQHCGIANMRQLPPDVRSFAIRLHANPEKIAPNSPMLPLLAEALKQPTEAVRAFTKGEPMTDRFLKKIQNQMAHGTVWRGGQGKVAKTTKVAAKQPQTVAVSPKKKGARDYKPRSPLAKYLWTEHQLTIHDVSEKLHVKYMQMQKMVMGLMAPNHPLVVKLAELVRVPHHKIASYMKLAPMNESVLKRVASQLGLPVRRGGGRPPMGKTPELKQPKNGKAVVLYSGPVKVVPEPTLNGTGKKKGAYGPHNKLRKQELSLRQAVRDLVMTCNLTTMQNQDFTPPLPIAVLYPVLQDYLEKNHVRGNILVDPRFATYFDPPNAE
ncbi:MAG TPA: hypothetical protein VJS69_01200 [Candidatus Krumholzibacteria bacterium]|nr:hypothetical protein [Candidatus Krumholzibacteria bacterium]